MTRLSQALFVSLAIAASAAVAQDYPSKPLRAIVPFPPGGVVDTVARQVASKMSESMGQQVVVDNRAGASGSIGTALAAKSPRDGYTILFAFDTHAVNPHIYKNLAFDTLKDFESVSLVVKIPLAIAAAANVPASNLRELVALAKANPGKYSYASVGAGSSGHLAAEQLKLLSDIELVHVPYKGGGPAVADLLGGQIPFAFLAAGVVTQHIRSGKLKGLALTSAQRSAALPNVPTTAEEGFPQFDSGAWVGVVVPAGTPAAVIARLNTEVVKAVRDPAVSNKLSDQTMVVVASTPSQLDEFIRAEHDKWGRLIREAKLNLGE
ncbi:MAG: tripartite tricarboxylate transporter substrate binding protein [Betaproteobacteria bacterium]|nr:tripartite tricarboxylate transporter substrate binding protein [Betaproteobacteria bacterium]